MGRGGGGEGAGLGRIGEEEGWEDEDGADGLGGSEVSLGGRGFA